jgi:hypothetical protein
MLVGSFSKRRLLAIVTAVLFAIYYFHSSGERWHGIEQQPRTVAEFIPVSSDATEIASENLVESNSIMTVRSFFVEDALLTTSSVFAEASTFMKASDSIVPMTFTSSSTFLELWTSPASSAATGLTNSIEPLAAAQASPGPDYPVFATAVASSSSLMPSQIPGVVHDSHFYIDPAKHRTIWSTSTPNGEFFGINWRDGGSYNPNILPHPTQPDRYILVAQLQQSWADWEKGTHVMECTASFVEGVLACSDPPVSLPIERTPDTFCPGDRFPGSHDPRIFYGPNAPYILYGSHSAHSCHGMWIQDLHHLLPEFNSSIDVEIFREPTDVQRPPPYREIEKNYFLFWDYENNTYVHQDISPERIFTSLYVNGSVSADLAPAARDTDEACLNRYMPKFGIRNVTGDGIEYEAIHQTTNSLTITLCRRTDADCQPTNNNTFVMVIFQHKSYYSQHAEYFPYVMLFQQIAPFAIHALSTKSIWIHGRTALTRQTPSLIFHPWKEMPTDHSEMFFVVSMSWKTRGQMYHGYMDDEMFLGFGIEDSVSAGIDILASDLLQDLGYCSSSDED